MDIYSPYGTLVRYIPANEESNRFLYQWGSNNNPVGILKPGAIYKVDHTEVHSYHTKVYLTKYPELKFNSGHFRSVSCAD